MSICWDRSQISRASFRAMLLREREGIFMPSSTSDFQILRKQILTCIGTKVPRISLLDVVKNKELLVFTGTVGVYVVKSIGQCSISTS